MAEKNQYLIEFSDVVRYRNTLYAVETLTLIHYHSLFLSDSKLLSQASAWLYHRAKIPEWLESQLHQRIAEAEKLVSIPDSPIAYVKRNVNDSWEDTMNRVRVIEEILNQRGMKLVKL